MLKIKFKKIIHLLKKRKWLFSFIGIFLIILLVVFFIAIQRQGKSGFASGSLAFEVENGTLSGNAQLGTDPDASNNQYVQFGALVPGMVAGYSFDETSGTSASDSSGNNNTAAINGASWVAGQYGNALSFNGNTNYLSIPNSASLDIEGTELSIAFWLSPLATSGDTVLLGKFWNTTWSNPYYQYGVELQGANRPIFVLGTTTGYRTAAMGGSVLPYNQWSHVAITFDGSQVKFYLNGSLVNTVAMATTITARGNGMRIGADTEAQQFYRGLLDELQIYKRTLSQTEVGTIMGQAGGPVPTAGPATPTSVVVQPTIMPTPVLGVGPATCPVFPAIPNRDCTGWRHLVGDTVPYADGSSKTFTGLKTESCLVGRDPNDVDESAQAIYIWADNLIFEDCYFSKGLVVVGANVLIRRSQIHGIVSSHGSNNFSYRGLLMEDVEIEQEGDPLASQAVTNGGNFTCRQCDVHHTGSGLHAGDYTNIIDSFMHDFNYTEEAHGAGIGMGQGLGSHSVIKHNNIQCNRLEGQPGICSSAISIYGESKEGPGGVILNIYVEDILIENNLFNTSGAYCVHAPDSPGRYIRYKNNLFGKKYSPLCAGYNAVAYFFYAHDPVAGDPKRPDCPVGSKRPESPQCNFGNEWSGNEWEDGSGPVLTGNELTPTPSPTP